MPADSNVGTIDRLGMISGSYTPQLTNRRSATRRGPGPVAVDELHHRVEHRAAAVVGPGDVGEHERSRHQRERAVGVGRAVGGRERGDRAEAGPEQAPAGALPDQRQLGLQVRHAARR